jgi:hypothetical protein
MLFLALKYTLKNYKDGTINSTKIKKYAFNLKNDKFIRKKIKCTFTNF